MHTFRPQGATLTLNWTFPAPKARSPWVQEKSNLGLGLRTPIRVLNPIMVGARVRVIVLVCATRLLQGDHVMLMIYNVHRKVAVGSQKVEIMNFMKITFYSRHRQTCFSCTW